MDQSINSIEKLYIKLDRSIKYTGIRIAKNGRKYFQKIIYMCRLKPLNFEKITKWEKINEYKIWIDEYGNKLRLVNKDHKFNEMDVGSLSLLTSYNSPSCTDLYDNLPMHKVLKISKILFFMSAMMHNEPFKILAFMGIDNYLRVYILLYGRWQKISPLLLGMRILYFMAINIDGIKHREGAKGVKDGVREIKIRKEETIFFACDERKTYFIELPLTETGKRLLMEDGAVLKIDQGDK
jgi:hypothetical protein